jgi:hypothetical protein
MSILIRHPWTRQPQGSIRPNFSTPLGSKLLSICRLNGDGVDLVSGNRVTLGTNGVYVPNKHGVSLQSSGTTSYRASVPIDLSNYQQITIAFWLYWNQNLNDTTFAFAHDSSPTQRYIGYAPGYSPNTLIVSLSSSAAYHGNNCPWTYTPEAQWNYHVLTLDIASTARNGLARMWVNGFSAPLTEFSTDIGTATDKFLNSTMYFFSDSSGAWKGNGRLQDFTIFGGLLTPAEAQSLWVNPWQVYKPAPTQIWFPGPVSAAPTLSSPTMVNITTTTATPRVTVTF